MGIREAYSTASTPTSFGKRVGPSEVPRKDQNGPQTIAATRIRYSNNLRVWVTIGQWQARALIDSGCTGIFMTPQFARGHKVTLRKKKQPFPLQAIDGKPVTYNQGMVVDETEEIPLRIGRYRRMLQYDITEAPGSDVVLGLPWLKEANPYINWKAETIWFEGSPRPMPLSVVHESLDKIDICAMTNTETEELIRTNPEEVQILWSKEDTPTTQGLDIPTEYKEFEELFRKEEDSEALLAY